MSSTATESQTQPPDQNSEVLALVHQILVMPDQQRQALARVWAAMDPSFGQDQSQRGGSFPSEAIAQDGVIDPNAVAKLTEWISAQQPLPPKERIEKLKAALDQESEEWVITLLHAEIAKVQNAHPWLAAENAVVRYAYEHPVLMFVALFGLGLGLYRFGKVFVGWIF
ncbi:hypothetical protein [Polaromonas aquatica]|uniref:Uncharacterized protein n=1 Tax=Polaromonas aquatica TaxID=332657 RepID=A0ABW1TUC9_9BURK